MGAGEGGEDGEVVKGLLGCSGRRSRCWQGVSVEQMAI